MNQTYKHSGNFSVAGLILGIITGLAAGFILAYAYAWGIIQIPEVKLACIVTMAYGALLGVAAAMGMKWGKVRNAKIAGFAAIVPAVASLYCSWAFWAQNIFPTFAKKELNPFRLMARPQALWELVKLLNQYGTWGMSKGDVTKGTELWVIWGLEALVVLGCAAMGAVAVLEMQPFCEKCKLWCSSTESLRLSPGDPVQIKQLLAKHDLSFLEKLGPGSNKTSHISAQLHSCKNCGELNTLTLRQTNIQSSKWRRNSITTVNLAVKFLLSRQEADAFRNTAHNIKQLSKAAHA